MGEVGHWFFIFFVVGGLLMLFLNRPKQSHALVGTATGGLNDISNTMKNYVSGGN